MIDQSEMLNFWLRMEKWLPKVKQIFFSMCRNGILLTDFKPAIQVVVSFKRTLEKELYFIGFVSRYKSKYLIRFNCCHVFK